MTRILGHTLMIAVAVSLLVHIGAWFGLYMNKISAPAKKTENVEIVLLDDSAVDQKKLQIVEQADKSVNEEIPDEASYLSKNNQKVAKETKASRTGDFKNSAGVGGANSAPIAAKPAANTPSAETEKNTREKNEVSKNGDVPMLSDLRPKFNPSQFVDANTNARSGGEASQTNDHLKDKPSELETLLNTREFVYYTYYQRIRTQIRQYWEPSIRGKVRKIFASGRNIAAEKDHVTRVVIILDNQGRLKGVQVIGESGLRDLDDAAVEAFRSAEPFPNPPKGIIESDGTIRINWDFILEA
jgi:TonB family protein